MCTLAIYFKSFPAYPVVIAANRDEYLARPAAPPARLAGDPIVIGGRDLKAGGTWLGLNEHGLVAGLLNRRNESRADPTLRSRGLLCLDTLQSTTATEAARFVTARRAADYNPFNLLLAARNEAFVAHNRTAEIELVRLEPGLHLLTNLDVDDFECPKISGAYDRFAALAHDSTFARDPVAMRGKLTALLADHTTQLDSRSKTPNAICLHLDSYGTRSSSLIFLGRDPGTTVHFFAPGPPCATAYQAAPIPHRRRNLSRTAQRIRRDDA